MENTQTHTRNKRKRVCSVENRLIFMKAGVQIAIATTIWLALGIPLWIYTLVVPRADLDFAQLEKSEANSTSPILAAARVAVSGEKIPDLAYATERLLNSNMEAQQSELRFLIQPECTPECEVCITAMLGESDVIGLDSGSTNLEVTYSELTLLSGRVPEVIQYLLLEHVYHEELEPMDSHDEVTVAYSPKYHITFSLIGEGGTPLNWEISEAVNAWLDPLLVELRASIANVTVDTQLGFYAEPGCDRQEVLTHADLATFVNFAEWSLASSMPYPTLNFLLYVPTSPLDISQSPSNSFIVPQWGGVVIAKPETESHLYTVDELQKPLQMFAKHLLALLGMRETPGLPPPNRAPIEVRLSALSRFVARRGIRGAAASLDSLRRLAANMPHIAIPEKVADRAKYAENEIETALQALGRGDLAQAAYHSGNAYVSADRAFFDKHMVAQSFVPDEQKLAVYAPLLGPLFVVILSGWIRFFRERKASQALNGSTSKEASIKPEISKTE